MKKPWLAESDGRRLQAFIGAQGIPTGHMESPEELVFFASELFELPEIRTATIAQAVQAVSGMSKKGRRKSVARNRERLMKGFTTPSPKPKPEAVSAPSEDIQEALQRMESASGSNLIDGGALDVDGKLDIDPVKLLRKIVSAVISSGNAHILWEYPDVLAFFGSRIPERQEVAHLDNVDERMFEAKERWPNLADKSTRSKRCGAIDEKKQENQ